MIYFTNKPKLVMQKMQDAVARSNCVLFTHVEMQFFCEEDFVNFVDKWTERYQLTLSPKERFKQKKNGNPTFDLIIHPNLDYEFYQDVLVIAKNQPVTFQTEDFFRLSQHPFSISFYLFCNIDSQQVLEGTVPIEQINGSLKKHVEGAEKFSYIFTTPIKYGNYELVRLTQKRSLKDELEGREKNASDWTWRIGSDSYGKVQKQGEVLINRWNQCIGKSEEEKQAYFEKHFSVLENYHGFRGVRKQVGTLWAKERKVFKAKYGEKYLQYFRPLTLYYVQRLESKFCTNLPSSVMLERLKAVFSPEKE